MKIVLLGTGNTATVLGLKLKEAGHTILQVFGRSADATGALANALNATPVYNLQLITKDADVYIIAVYDGAIEDIVNGLKLSQSAVLVHTAAAVSVLVLTGAAANYGVFYPLQTLKKGLALPQQIPILIEANNKKTEAVLETLAWSISDQVGFASGDERMKLHLAAVFCNNFVNHLYALAEGYCADEGVDFNLLKPLISETALRIESTSPAGAQTGPAARRDAATIEKHLQLLTNHPALTNLYTMLTKSIQSQC